MRWVPLTAVVLFASCSSLWNSCGELDQIPCDPTGAATCESGLTCAASGFCTPVGDGGLDGSGCADNAPPPHTPCTSGFCWDNPLSHGNRLNAVWGASASDVWAVGDGGTILHYNGMKWAWADSPTSLALRGIWGTRASDIWLVGDGDKIYHWNGCRYDGYQIPPGKTLNAVSGTLAKDVWAVGENSTILHFDGVSTWTASPGSSTLGVNLYGVSGSGLKDVWAVGIPAGQVQPSPQGVVVHWDGSQWMTIDTRQQPLGLRAVRTEGVLGPIWAVGDQGTLLTGDGKKWISHPPMMTVNPDLGTTLSPDFLGIAGDGVSGIVLAGSDGQVWQQASATGAATPMTGKAPDALTAVWRSPDATIWAVGQYGAILHCANNSCVPASGGVTTNLNGVYAGPSGGAWAVGDKGMAVTLSSDASATTAVWDIVSVNQPTVNWNAVTGGPDPSSPGKAKLVVWAVGETGAVWQVNGLSGAHAVAPTSAALMSVWTDSGGQTWAGSGSGTLFSWTSLAMIAMDTMFGPVAPINAITGDSPTSLWVADSQGKIWHVNASGSGVMQANNPSGGLSGIWAKDNNTLFAVGVQESIVSLLNMGQPTTEHVTTGAGNLTGVWGTQSLNPVWAVGVQGKILQRTTAATWNAVTSGTMNDLYGIYGDNSGHAWVVGQHGTILSYHGP